VALGSRVAVTHGRGRSGVRQAPMVSPAAGDPEAEGAERCVSPRQRRTTRETGGAHRQPPQMSLGSTRRLQMWAGFDVSPCQRLTSHQTKVGVRLLLTEQRDRIDHERVVR
jgi:hypothetical protein